MCLVGWGDKIYSVIPYSYPRYVSRFPFSFFATLLTSLPSPSLPESDWSTQRLPPNDCCCSHRSLVYLFPCHPSNNPCSLLFLPLCIPLLVCFIFPYFCFFSCPSRPLVPSSLFPFPPHPSSPSLCLWCGSAASVWEETVWPQLAHPGIRSWFPKQITEYSVRLAQALKGTGLSRAVAVHSPPPNPGFVLKRIWSREGISFSLFTGMKDRWNSVNFLLS